MRRAALTLGLAVLALAACDPREMADKAVARAAESVIAPVMGGAAARCLVEAARPEELRALARDVGVEAGTATLATIATIAARPEAQPCLNASAG